MSQSKLLKIVLSLCLLGWLLAQVDYAALRTELAGAEWWWYLASLALLPLTLWCGIRKWQMLMTDRGLELPTSLLTRYFLIGHFFGNFFPSNFGGDVVRATLVTRHAGTQYWAIAGGSALVERLTGLVGLFITLAIGVLLHYEWFVSLDLIYPVLLALLGFVVALVLVFSNIGSGVLALFARVPVIRKPVGLIQKLHDLILEYRGSMRVLLACIGLSVFFYCLNALQIWFILRMFPPVTVEWTTQIVTFALTSLIAMIPVSFNGYGIQEGGYTVLLSTLGYTFTLGLTVAILMRGLSIAISIVGGLLFATANLSRDALEKDMAAMPGEAG